MYDELIKALRNCTNPDKCCEDCGFFDKCYKSTEHFSIEEQAADAIEELQKRKHGKWIPSKEPPWVDCSECGQGSVEYTNFCPNCGADMRGDSDV